MILCINNIFFRYRNSYVDINWQCIIFIGKYTFIFKVNLIYKFCYYLYSLLFTPCLYLIQGILNKCITAVCWIPVKYYIIHVTTELQCVLFTYLQIIHWIAVSQILSVIIHYEQQIIFYNSLQTLNWMKKEEKFFYKVLKY